jgi:hypothetical protein
VEQQRNQPSRTQQADRESSPSEEVRSDFRRQAEQRQSGIIDELLYMLRTNKMWWLLPIVALLMVLAAVIVLGGSAAAPFIYTLF